MIKPIETYYNGYRFRSRLEARWAVFFDEMGIKYEYEPEGYCLPNGMKYLPDFRVYVRHRSYTDEFGPIYVEVKGVMSDEDLAKIRAFSGYSFTPDEPSLPGGFLPILVVGDVPKSADDAIWQGFEKVDFYSYNYIDGDSYPAFFFIYNGEPWVAGPDHDQSANKRETDIALLKARQARFEHGESGVTA